MIKCFAMIAILVTGLAGTNLNAGAVDSSQAAATLLAPFRSQPLHLKALYPSFAAESFEDYVRPDLPSTAETKSKDYWSNENTMQLEYRRIIFSLTRYTPDPNVTRLTGSSDSARKKMDLLQSLPSTLQDGSLKDSLESLGKIVEPGFTIKIEF